MIEQIGQFEQMVYEKLDTSYLALKQHIITDKKLNDAIEQ
jgi:hypothetical protein